MQKLVRTTLTVFVVIVGATAALVLGGLAYLWFFPSQSARSDLPYLGGLVTALLLEVVGVVLALARNGFKYLPHVENHKNEAKTLSFMAEFITGGSTVQIVSSRLAWIKNSPDLLEKIRSLALEGTLVEVITPTEVTEDIRKPLHDAGVKFFTTGEPVPPEARFTLINGTRSGAERLAIARGSHPDHEVTVFDGFSGPQIIAMAKDIIRKSKGLDDGSRMG
ncbi:MAG: hypothetical protein RBR35_11800 [Salinivirgaceae bacterium]|nr:hypothetical protein [Salinivirgaceae bacterium]